MESYFHRKFIESHASLMLREWQLRGALEGAFLLIMRRLTDVKNPTREETS